MWTQQPLYENYGLIAEMAMIKFPMQYSVGMNLPTTGMALGSEMIAQFKQSYPVASWS